ncbi:hypothetical protein FSARC_8221 [Fusarium sarcochroum]|uniref:Uncharacterized protein n=1 Tax=Fusarium sarcochroum TaxID=1208366 RepID=A0A8H4TTG4_9HYPO|nr:hypothetical protein FSARC_8221 [Fusarium sarcochroum]
MEETIEETIVCAPTSDVQASEGSCKRMKTSTSTARSISTYRDDRRGRCVPRPRSEKVVKDDKCSHQKKRTEHVQDTGPLALRRSSRLSQNTEDRNCLPERAPGIVSGDISGRIQCDSSDDSAGASDDWIISTRNSPHYPPDKCEATVEVLALEPQQRDDMPQMKIIPRLEKAEEDRLRRDQSSISPTYHNEHTPKVAENNTGNIPVQSHDRLDTRPVSKKTVAILDDISEHKTHNASLSVREKSLKASKSKNKMAKKDVIPSSTTTKATSLPGIASFPLDAFMGQRRNHDIQDRLPCIGLRELHERSLQPRFTYEEARWKDMQAQLLSVTNGVDQSNTKAEYYYL